jgi:PAS domain S-box-containing protein
MCDQSIDSLLIDAAACLVLAFDQDGRVVRFNHACEEATGCSAAEVVGQNIWNFADMPGSDDELRSLCGKLLQNRSPLKHEGVWTTRDGRRRQIVWNFALSADVQGHKRYVIATGDCVKEESHPWPHLRDKEVWFTKLIETADEGVGIIDAEGRLTYVNPRLSRIMGYPIEEIIGRQFFEFMKREEQDAGREHLSRRKRGLREDYEVRFVRKDGSEIWVQNRTNPLVNEQGQMIASLAMVADITERKHTEEKLRRSEQLHRRIIEAVPGGIVMVGTQGDILHANAEAERILGLRFDSKSQVYVSDFQSLTLREDGTECPIDEYPVTRCLRTGEPQPPATIGVLHPDGQIFWAIFTAIPSLDPDTGFRTGAVVTFLDITARKRTEDALRESEERFRLAVETSPDAMFYQDTDLRLIWVSKTAPGVTKEQVLGRTDEELVGKEEAARLAPLKRRILETGVVERAETHFEIEGKLHSYDLVFVRRTGPDGAVLGLAGYARDVTARTKAEEALKALNETLEERIAERTELLENQTRIMQSVLNGMSDGVLVADEQGNILMYNPAVERMAGSRRNDRPQTIQGSISRRKFFKADKVTPYQADELPLARAIRGETVYDEEILVRREVGGDAWVSVSAVPLRDDQGRPKGGVSVARDFTERKRAEDQLRESERHYRDLSDRNRLLIQEVEHRVGNNLAGLLGLVSVMRARTPDVEAFADAIESRLRAMAQVQRMLIDSAWRSVGLKSLVSTVLQEMCDLAPYVAEPLVDGPEIAVAPKRVLPLMLILVEWFTNSCKYGAHSEPGGRLHVTWSEESDRGQRRVRLLWEEHGGPSPLGPVIPSLGTELVQSFAERELRGSCRMTFPLAGAEHALVFSA